MHVCLSNIVQGLLYREKYECVPISVLWEMISIIKA